MKITQSIDLKKSQGKRCPFYSDRSDCSFLYCSYQYGNGICNSIYRGACIIFTSWSAGSAVFSFSMKLMVMDRYLARAVGISLILLVALMTCVSAFGMVGTTIYSRKKKYTK